MKSKKISAIIALALSVALLVPFTATANDKVTNKGDVKSAVTSKATGILNQSPAVAAQRAQISQLNADIVALKQQAKSSVQKIQLDLAGTKGIDSITSSQDYKDIVALLQSLKSTLGKAEAHEYMSGLINAKGKNGKDLSTSLDGVIIALTQKKADLTAAIASLNAAVTKADAIAAIKAGKISAWNDFKIKADQKKLTIDQNHALIAQAFADDKSIISTIIATASSNKAILQTKPEEVAAIEAKLATITQTLKGIYNSSVNAQQKQFNTDKSNKDYTAMLADLDKIISIQQARITALADTKTQLNAILVQLNAAISSSVA
jgi:hypothetical protein